MTPAQYRKERTARGLTQAGLAALLGVPRETVNRREAGKQPINAEAVLAIGALSPVGKMVRATNCDAAAVDAVLGKSQPDENNQRQS